MKAQGEDATTGSAKRTATSHGVKLLETVRNLQKTLPTFLFKLGKSMLTQSDSQAEFDVLSHTIKVHHLLRGNQEAQQQEFPTA